MLCTLLFTNKPDSDFTKIDEVISLKDKNSQLIIPVLQQHKIKSRYT